MSEFGADLPEIFGSTLPTQPYKFDLWESDAVPIGTASIEATPAIVPADIQKAASAIEKAVKTYDSLVSIATTPSSFGMRCACRPRGQFCWQNTLVLDVVNSAQNGGNSSGLDVQFVSSGVPETSTWLMLLLSLVTSFL